MTFYLVRIYRIMQYVLAPDTVFVYNWTKLLLIIVGLSVPFIDGNEKRSNLFCFKNVNSNNMTSWNQYLE